MNNYALHVQSGGATFVFRGYDLASEFRRETPLPLSCVQCQKQATQAGVCAQTTCSCGAASYSTRVATAAKERRVPDRPMTTPGRPMMTPGRATTTFAQRNIVTYLQRGDASRMLDDESATMSEEEETVEEVETGFDRWFTDLHRFALSACQVLRQLPPLPSWVRSSADNDFLGRVHTVLQLVQVRQGYGGTLSIHTFQMARVQDAVFHHLRELRKEEQMTHHFEWYMLDLLVFFYEMETFLSCHALPPVLC